MVEIAFEFKSCLADELFVFGLAILGRVLAQVGEEPDRFEVDVQDGIGVGKQADGIGRSALAKEYGENNCADDEEDCEGDPEVTPTMSHG